MNKVVSYPFHGTESEVLTWLFEHELITPTDHWTRSPTTGQLEPLYQQPFYGAAMQFADGQGCLWDQECAAIQDCPDEDTWLDAGTFEGCGRR